ncbi:MAG: DNA repair protein RecO [Bacteroidetes bacterium HGW-Bacteroidetes-14]|jgi:DNA repair protein RecO (recombination protein O)|nr:MAG: DNA repair protein RecO [Bacteroidetes bacterium HGW-Bacteroidetes-14]
MNLKTAIIVLHKTKYGDSSIIIHGYSAETGRCGLIVRKGGRGGIHSALSQLHPLSIIEAELSDKNRGDLKNVKEFRTLYNLPGIRENLSKSSIAMYVSEFIFRCIHEVEPNPSFYEFLVKSVLLLEEMDSGFANFHLWFLVEYAKRSGYGPEFTTEDKNSLFDIVSASFTTTPQIGSKCFSEADSSILATILQYREESMHMLRIPGRQRNSFATAMTEYLAYHMGHQINVRSLDILREVFE